MRRTIKPRESFVVDASARKLLTVRVDDPLWAFFTDEEPEPTFEGGFFVRLYVPEHAEARHVNKAVEWLTGKGCSVRLMPRYRTKAPALPVQSTNGVTLRSIADRHITDVFNRVYGQEHPLKQAFERAKIEVFERAGV